MTDRLTHLRELLTAHEPADALERDFRQRMLELSEVAGDPFSRTHYRPGHFTASAFVLSPDRRSLLLIHHGKLGRWLQPGGHVEPGDADVIEAARREVIEETGVEGLALLGSGLLDVDVHVIPAHGEEPEHSHYDVRVLFAADGLESVAGEEVRGVRWVPLDAVDGVESDASVMRAVARLVSV